MTNPILLMVLVWPAILIGIPVMKKLEPENHWYPIYAFLIGIVFTTAMLMTN